MMKSGLHHPEAFRHHLEAEQVGVKEGKDWTVPLIVLPWRDHIDHSVEELRERFGITEVLPAGDGAQRRTGQTRLPLIHTSLTCGAAAFPAAASVLAA